MKDTVISAPLFSRISPNFRLFFFISRALMNLPASQSHITGNIIVKSLQPGNGMMQINDTQTPFADSCGFLWGGSRGGELIFTTLCFF